ncbi:MAG: hypothetical protein AAB414_01690 [Patescibacteria group bacterium]
MSRIDHSVSQIDLPLNLQILNISVNLSRLSQWVFEGYDKRRQLIDKFMKQTENFLADLDKQNISNAFESTLERVREKFAYLKKTIGTQEKRLWAEEALTWANILQHRAKLA